MNEWQAILSCAQKLHGVHIGWKWRNNRSTCTPFDSTYYIVSYPQDGDRIVTIDSMTSLHPMYKSAQSTARNRKQILKTKKKRKRKDTLISNGDSPGSPWSQSGRRRNGYGGADLWKWKVLSLEWKREGAMDDGSGESGRIALNFIFVEAIL